MIIKIKYMLLIALAALVGCSSDDFVGDQTVRESNENVAISLGSGVTAITRADKTGSEAATDLNNQFYVYGIKNENTDGAGNVQTGHLVFSNYVVKWVDNSANTTTSNTKGWEYVGYTLTEKERTNVTDNSGNVAQTIKYWDYGASDYTFYAFSAKPNDIENGYITVTKVQNKKTTDEPAHTVYDNGYSVNSTENADLDKLFFSERVNITDKSNTDRTQANKYGGNVTFRFHNVVSKVRVAMYETIPGYTVTINKFSVDNDGTDPAFSEMTDEVPNNFAANLKNYTSGIAGTVNVTYVASGTNQNYPIVSFTPTGGGTMENVLTLGTGLKAGITIGETATGATYDKAEKAYTRVYPNEVNQQNLKLKLSYTLTAPVTGETIVINDKTAVIPSQYLQWKSGYAYTYLFKITDDDLYPITFDAVEIAGEDGAAEYITIVNEPSITTFGVKDSKYTAEKNEYENGTDIYATFVKGSTVQTPSLTESTKANYVQIYQVTTTNATTYPITELSVAERLAETPSGSAEITCTNVTTSSDGTYFTDTESPSVVSPVPAEDGTTKTINAVKLPGAKTNTYAIEYITYEAVSLSVDDSLVGYYSESDGKFTKHNSGTYSTGTYYKQVKTYKVIKVVAPAPGP